MAEVSRLNQERANEREETVDGRTGGRKKRSAEGEKDRKREREGGREREKFLCLSGAARAERATLFAAPIRCLEVTERGREEEKGPM